MAKKINVRELTRILLLSGQFKLRRLRYGKSKKPSAIQAVVVDIDGTLLKTATALKALERAYGKEEADRINRELTNEVIRGELSPNRALIEGHRRLIKAGFTERDWRTIAEDSIKKGELRQDLVEALKELQKRGLKVVLVTQSSSFVAEELAKRLGFDGYAGSIEIVDKEGRIKGLRRFIGPKERIKGLEIEPKLMSSRPFLSGMKSRNVAYITDEYSDIGLTHKAGYNFLLKSEELPYPKMTGVTRKFRIFDAEVTSHKLKELIERTRRRKF